MRILVTGASGLLGGWLVDHLSRRRDDVLAYGGPARGDAGVDLTDPEAVLALLRTTRPDAVIHGAALAAMGDCAGDPARAKRVNVDATANLARACGETRTRLVHVSTDLVFDGESAPYDEAGTTAPLSVYGRTKLESETAALAAPNAVVVRVALLFGPTKNARIGFFDTQLAALARGETIRLFDDEWRTPLSLRTAAEGLRAVAGASMNGILHLAGSERLSRYEMGLVLAGVLGVRDSPIVRSSRLEVPGESRARDVSLDVTKFRTAFPEVELPSFENECRLLCATGAKTDCLPLVTGC